MSPLQNNVETKLKRESSPATCAQGNRSPLELPLLRFGLKHLLWVVTGVCLISTVAAVCSPAATMGVLLGVTFVSAHVGSTALGGRLRAQSDERRAQEATSRVDSPPPTRVAQVGQTASLPIRPVSALEGHQRSIERLPMLVALSGLVSGGSAIILLTIVIGDRTSPAGIVVGALSLGIVGAWCAFLLGNFIGIVRHVLLQSWGEPPPESSVKGAPTTSRQ